MKRYAILTYTYGDGNQHLQWVLDKMREDGVKNPNRFMVHVLSTSDEGNGRKILGVERGALQVYACQIADKGSHFGEVSALLESRDAHIDYFPDSECLRAY